MVGFIKRKIETPVLGEKLKKIREKSGVSLVEIATQTKIKKEYLEKIEKGDYDKLPFDVYVKGFLRSYARYLNLDPEKVVNQFNKEVGIRDNIKKYRKKEDSTESRFNFPSLIITPKIVSIFLSVLIILIGFSYFYFEVDNFSKEPSLIVETPFPNMIIEDSLVEVAGKTDFENKILINNEVVFVDSEGRFKEKVGLQKGVNEITIEAVNKFGKNTQKKINLIANYETQALVAGKEVENKKDSEDESFDLEIQSREESIELSYQIEEQGKQTTIIHPGVSLKIKVEDRIKISSSKISDTYVKINEEEFFLINETEEVENFKMINLNKEGVFLGEDENSENNKN
jgi:cytoskeletal protein RodZ